MMGETPVYRERLKERADIKECECPWHECKETAREPGVFEEGGRSVVRWLCQSCIKRCPQGVF